MPLITPLKALADEKRLKILQMLIGGDLCVGALARRVGISVPAVSQHLQILRKAGLVKGEKRGYWTHYVVDRSALARIISELNDLAAAEKTGATMCWRMDDSLKNKTKSQEGTMCQNCCQHPEKPVDKPENCTPEQIRKCHGDGNEHPCISRENEPLKKQ